MRNPQAVARVLMVTGDELLLCRSAWLWLLLPLTLLCREGLVGSIESRPLAQECGEEFRRDAARVPKWLPRRPRT